MVFGIGRSRDQGQRSLSIQKCHEGAEDKHTGRKSMSSPWQVLNAGLRIGPLRARGSMKNGENWKEKGKKKILALSHHPTSPTLQ